MKKEYIEFIEYLNELFQKECTVSFKNQIEHFCYNAGNININLQIINSPELKFLEKKLGQSYWKYVVLHEYGHFLYNHQVKTILEENKELITSSSLYKIFEKINLMDDQSNLYVNTQYYSACELVADYFIYQYIEKFKNEGLEFEKFLDWRKKIVLEDFNKIYNKREKFLLTTSLHYFHIPCCFKELSIQKNIILDVVLTSIKNCELVFDLVFKIDLAKSEKDKEDNKTIILDMIK